MGRKKKPQFSWSLLPLWRLGRRQPTHFKLFGLSDCLNTGVSNWRRECLFCFCSADPPSPPRNLKSSVVGVYPLTQIRLSWSSSSYTGGLPVNYSIKVCKNDSITPGACKWIKRAECKPVNVLSTKRDFLCILDKSDFKLSLGDMAYAYNISVIAANAVGSARTVIYLPYVGFLEGTGIFKHQIF